MGTKVMWGKTAGLVVAALCALQAGPITAAAQQRATGTIIEIAPRAPSAPPRAAAADRSGRSRRTEAQVLRDPALAAADAVGTSGILPVGTTARVQNLQNGRTTLVRVQAGSEGRLLDITPPVARALGVTGNSAQIMVAPLAVPQPDGTIRLGEGTRLAGTVAAPAVSDRPTD
ncbi:hypothetical protein [Muricoccus radiodurans]|uniref:hypothetical protein n=1 Tax=Muricoccus radiodurans TaxID=2231721 RepID=UPI003CEEBF3F